MTNQSIAEGETVVSSGGTFKLGFFSPSGSSKRYVGIWYKQILPHVQTVVWVANRETIHQCFFRHFEGQQAGNSCSFQQQE
ncbi:hypothetical protein P3S68_027207 [Capsicum galapagoense]